MRTCILYVLLFATLLPTVSPWGIIAHYQLNREYIARVLCENRDKPQLHCDGQCYLAKRLKAQQNRQDQETTERVQHIPAMQLFCQTTVPFQFLPIYPIQVSISFLTNQLPAYRTPLTGLFRPPRV